MKIYQVCKSYYDGDHDHGQYQSPLFLRREDAEKFASMVFGPDVLYDKRWWSDNGMREDTPPYIHEITITEQAPVEVELSKTYLCITYT